MTSIGVLDVSSDDELEEEVEELVELVEQDLEDSEDSDVTQFKLSFAFIWRHVLSLSMALLFSDSESWLLGLFRLSNLFRCLFARWQ